MKPNQEGLLPNFKAFQSILMELIREGVLIISHRLQPTYLNSKAKEICQKLWNVGSYYSAQLPPILSDISHQLFRDTNPEATSFVMDYQIDGKQTIRIRACRVAQVLDQELVVPSQEQKYILILLEDRNATLEEELQVEQKKYGFTEREVQILNLLSQTCTYQEIAKTLQISLNTVKFHVKNIYSKKRGYLQQEK